MIFVSVESIRVVSTDVFELEVKIDSELKRFTVQREGGEIPLMTAPHEFWEQLAGEGKAAAKILFLVSKIARGEPVALPQNISKEEFQAALAEPPSLTERTTSNLDPRVAKAGFGRPEAEIEVRLVAEFPSDKEKHATLEEEE